MVQEIYIDIKGYKGLYQVSNLGNVYSFITNKVLKANSIGEYLGVTLCKGGAKKIHLIHILVATYFCDNTENKPCVNHKKGIKHDNRYTELEWVTRSENGLHAFQMGLSKPNKTNLGNFGVNSFNKVAISVYQKDGVFIKDFSNAREGAKAFGVSETSISNCLNGRSKSAGGLVWEYQN